MNHGTSSVQEFSQRAGKVNARKHLELFGEEPAGKKAKNGEASRPETHRTKLHDAVSTRDEAAVSHILHNESDLIDVQEDISKMTALHIAATHGHTEIVSLLLSAGSDGHLQNQSGMTALHMALAHKHEGTAKVIIDADAKNNIQDEDGKTALHYAAERNYVEIVKRLLASGADSRLQDRSGMTALHVALKHYNDVSAEALIEADAESSFIQDKDGKTALHYAAEIGYRETVKRLLASGADTRLQDRSGMTALHIAILKFKRLPVEVLIEADPESGNIQDKDGKTALHRAIEEYHEEAVLRQLLFREVNPHVSDNGGQYPLMAALDQTLFWSLNSLKYEVVGKLILSMCVLRSIDINWKELDLDHDRTTYCAGLLSEFEAELRRMKQTKLRGTDLSYHDFVRGHVSRVVRYLENENARSVLLVDDAARRFPNYGEFFAFKVRRAEKRRILNNKCLQCFAVLPKEKKQPSLPRTCTDLILAHLSEREMQNFIASFRVKS